MLGRARWAVALALATLSSSCTPTPAPIPSPSPHIKTASHLQLIEADDAQTLDPALIDDPVSLAIGNEIFEGLTRLDANQRPAPGLAERWDISDGGQTYTFHLRTAHYRSGALVQAQDAVTAWTRVLAPATASPLTIFFAPLGARYPGETLTGVDVVDARTLRVHLAKPDSRAIRSTRPSSTRSARPGRPGSVSTPWRGAGTARRTGWRSRRRSIGPGSPTWRCSGRCWRRPPPICFRLGSQGI